MGRNDRKEGEMEREIHPGQAEQGTMNPGSIQYTKELHKGIGAICPKKKKEKIVRLEEDMRGVQFSSILPRGWKRARPGKKWVKPRIGDLVLLQKKCKSRCQKKR